uniref:Rab-GAP TBC domain-containing protein n=1 Tax=Quercus lobata TaxID=97700 RepID=A0A7N2MSJ5_QUELO
MRNTNNNNNNSAEDQRKKESTLTSLDSRFNQTLRNVQGLLKGRSIPGKILLTRRSDPLDESSVQERTPEYERSLSYNEAGSSDHLAKAAEEEVQSTSKLNNNTNVIKLKTSTSEIENTSKEVQKSAMGARATDSARVMKFTKALSGTTVILEKLRELAWSGIPDYIRPDVWRLLLGYAPPNSDRKEGILRRKRLEYLDCVSQYYDIPDTERSDDEINMLRQIAVDCPRTVPDVSFFQEPQVQKSLERILYTWEFNDWELAASYSLLHFIQTRIPRGGGCDRLCWDLNGSGKFDIRSFYHKIRNAAPSSFPWKGIWKVKVPKRVAFFIWTAAYGQILTLDNLMLRGCPLTNRCCENRLPSTLKKNGEYDVKSYDELRSSRNIPFSGKAFGVLECLSILSYAKSVLELLACWHQGVKAWKEAPLFIIWAIRHPASGYVQGINDLATPFLVVFLSEYLEGGADNWSISDLSLENISNLEADCYWCLSKLLDGMQDHYTFAQPGIQRLVFKLKELVRRIDEPVSRHMEEQGLEFLQFAFRWFNCLLIREIPFHLVTRLWDTYLAEGDALPDFLVYIFASFLLTWSDKLQKLDFQELVMFLQHLPTQNWTHQELEMVLSRAFMWHSMFNNSPSHLAS